ncbi:ABC transporter ATP-binding protein [Cellulosimicrobium composti]|uniref:ABC transporter ATP-binding protein n=1 Tax=Cellulosimicrobium composti TaxID=2672572 RepID=A0ABX0B5U1_9MICO|nr:ABC transporter ATP-binding protein [Cellulosimicrobium composti]NDO88197.1 ABC transporter ATP-binding protein [Cellulosimicrobium composti]
MSRTSVAPRTAGAPVAPALAGHDLRLSYDARTVVHGAALDLAPGAVTALIGPNGSGKSTLLRSLARLHRPDAGTVALDDAPDALALHAKDFARRVTLLSQSRPTPSGVSVRDVVAYGRHPYRGRFRSNDPDGPRAIAHAMDVTGITAMADRGVDELSGGELQRVWLATCLAQDTRVLLLDEPTTYLDLRYQVELLDLVRDLATQHGVAVGVVLHDLNQAAAVADHVVLLHRGVVRATGPADEVLTSELLTEVYGIHVDVYTHPLTGRTCCEPLGRHAARLDAAVLV